jgi:hypothetical protein
MQHGIQPLSPHTACARGWYTTYRADAALQVTRVDLGLAGDQWQPPLLGGVAPFREFSVWVYDGLALPVPYTGRLLLGADFLDEYVYMGFQAASVCARGLELRCEEGRIVEQTDRSDELRSLREQGGPPDRIRRIWETVWAPDQRYPRWGIRRRRP